MHPAICLLIGSSTWLVIQCSIKTGSLLTWGGCGGGGGLDWKRLPGISETHTPHQIPNTQHQVNCYVLFLFIGIQVSTLVWINANDFSKTLAYPMFSSSSSSSSSSSCPVGCFCLAPVDGLGSVGISGPRAGCMLLC